MIERPNLFKYATKELSQDAFICWLLEWANVIYEKSAEEDDTLLHNCAIEILKNFFTLNEKELPSSFVHFQPLTQEKNIDILIKLDEYIILIEDKIGTNEHSDQLKRYKEYILKHYQKNEDQIICIYFKTGEQLNLKFVEESGFKPFLRQKFLEILNKYNIKNHIFIDFRENLKKKDSRAINYKNIIFKDWQTPEWQGFITEVFKVQENQNLSGYGSSKGFYWKSLKIHHKEVWFYLRINFSNSEIVFKLEFGANYDESKNDFRTKIQKLFNQNTPTIKIVNMQKQVGKQITIAKYTGDFPKLKDEKIDIKSTRDLINKIEDIYTHILNEYHP